MSSNPDPAAPHADVGASGSASAPSAPSPKADPAASNAEALPPTALAGLAALAREAMSSTPDKATPAATRTMAAVVRDLKGMPEILVTREHTHKIKIQRRGKLGAITLEYLPKIRALEVGHVGFPDADPTTMKQFRYTFAEASGPAGEWHRLDDGGELIDDIKQVLVKLYPEIANRI